MASEAEVSVPSLFERWMARSFLSGFTTTRSESDTELQDHESTDPPSPIHGSSLDRIILINPVTQGIVVIRGGSTGFDSLVNDIMRKEGQPPASQTSMDAMPSLEIKGTEEIGSLGSECVICLEEWGVGDVAKEMPCKHKFHGACVEKWLKIHGSCPVCRHKMPVEDSDKKTGDENGRMSRRREFWVTFTFGNGSRSTSEEDRSRSASSPNQES